MLIEAPLLSMVVSQRIKTVHEGVNLADLNVLKAMIEAGDVRPVVGRTYPLSDVADAIRWWGEGHSEGKLVIAM